MSEYTRAGALVDRSGLSAYLHLVMAPDDPVPRRRWSERDAETRGTRDEHVRARKALRRRGIDDWKEVILHALDVLARPATFNALMITAADMHASDAPHAAEAALWQLVADGVLVHTLARPVRFKRAPRFLALFPNGVRDVGDQVP